MTEDGLGRTRTTTRSACCCSGRAADEVDVRGRSAPGDTLLLLLNAGTRSHSYTLPRMERPGLWEELLNTARPGPWARHRAQRRRQPDRPLEHAAAPLRTPRGVTVRTATAPLGSTYRLQLQRVWASPAPARSSPTCTELGIETLYVSPILAAAAGQHPRLRRGRPDPARPRARAPTEEFEALLAALAAHGMRLLIDIVPNHMATDPANRWWWDVLRLGRDVGPRAVFDIDWAGHGGRVLLAGPGPSRWPRSLGRRPVTVECAADERRRARARRPELPARPGHGAGAGALTASEVRASLERQHYRPAYWRLAGDEGNYRRFFDIDGLVGVRVEDPPSSTAPTAAPRALVATSGSPGCGSTTSTAWPTRPATCRLARPGRAGRPAHPAPVVLVEKILAADEALPQTGRSTARPGYEFADLGGGSLRRRGGGPPIGS